MKNILLILLISLPLLSFSQHVEDTLPFDTTISESMPSIPFLGVEEPNRADSISEFTENMIRPHIEDTIKQEDLPMFLLTLEGDTIGMILTVAQVQDLDHSVEVGMLLEKALIECDQLDVFYIQVIDGLENQIVIYEKEISNLKSQSGKRDDMIKKLQTGLAKKQSQLDISNDQLMNDEIIISGLEKDLNKQKIKTIAGFGTAGLIGAAVIVLGILFGTR